MRKPRKIKATSKGSVALNHCGASSEEIARTVKATVGMVNYWRSGERKPEKHRTALKRTYGIEEPAWDEPADIRDPLAGLDVLGRSAARAPAVVEDAIRDSRHASPDPTATKPREVLDLAGELLEQVRAFSRTVETDKLLTLTERGRILRDAAITLEKAAKITGANGDIPVSKIVKSPAWSRLVSLIADALATDPDALQKVVDAVKDAGRG
jgi:hypothetical protein